MNPLIISYLAVIFPQLAMTTQCEKKLLFFLSFFQYYTIIMMCFRDPKIVKATNKDTINEEDESTEEEAKYDQDEA